MTCIIDCSLPSTSSRSHDSLSAFLAVEEYYQMVEERLPDLGNDFTFQSLRDIYAVDFGPERTRDRAHLDVAIVPAYGIVHWCLFRRSADSQSHAFPIKFAGTPFTIVRLNIG